MLTLIIVWYWLGLWHSVLCECRVCRVRVPILILSRALIDFRTSSMNITTQAYLDTSSASNPALSYGADGIAGLGFTSLSTIDALVNNSDSSSGRSLLYNLFMQNPSEPNFIAFALERSSDDDADSDDVEGSFSIGTCSVIQALGLLLIRCKVNMTLRTPQSRTKLQFLLGQSFRRHGGVFY